MNKCVERIYNGLIKENPTFVLMLGMCPTLAVTTSAVNGIGMGLSTTAVLIMSNMLISMLRKVIPDSVRMPAFIVVVASFVTIVDFLLEGFVPSLYDSLGLYIPLIVVNCIILGRAESYASKNPVLPSIFDGVGMGLGFTLGLTCIGIVRELLGAGPDLRNPGYAGVLSADHDLHPCAGSILRTVLSCRTSEQDQEGCCKERKSSTAVRGMWRRMCIMWKPQCMRRSSDQDRGGRKRKGTGGTVNAGIIIDRSWICFCK